MNFKKVEKDEFINYVYNYPNHLDVDVCMVGEPPVKSYNDFTDGKVWPVALLQK